MVVRDDFYSRFDLSGGGKSDNEKIRDWVRSYVKDEYNDKWKIGLSWSFKESYKKFSNMEYWMNNLKSYMLGVSGVLLFDGIYVAEENGNKDLHLHSVIYYDSVLSDSKVRNEIWNYCRRMGSVDVKEFLEDGDFDEYMMKNLYKKDFNLFNILGKQV
jgi:hypothetical protein